MYATHPSKEQVRAYLAQRGQAHVPPPSPEEIRRRLDWRAGPPSLASSAILLPSVMFQLGAVATFTWLCWPLVFVKIAKK